MPYMDVMGCDWRLAPLHHTAFSKLRTNPQDPAAAPHNFLGSPNPRVSMVGLEPPHLCQKITSNDLVLFNVTCWVGSVSSVRPPQSNITPKTLSQVEMYPFTSINFHNSSTIPAPATNGIARKLQVIALGARPVACRFNGGNPKAPRKTTSSRCGSCAWSGFLLIGHVAWLAHFNMLNVLISRGIGEPRNVQSSWASCWSLYIALSSV